MTAAWLCEFARDDGFAGFLRLELRDDVAWFWTYLVGVPGVEGIVAVRDHEVPRPRQGLEVRADGLWAELWCEAPREHWTFGLEAFGVRLDRPEEGLRAGGEIGDRIPVGLDLEWEVGDVVAGEVLVGSGRIALEGWGRFLEGHELRDEPVRGEVEHRVLVPLGASAWLERAVVRGNGGDRRWSQRVGGEDG